MLTHKELTDLIQDVNAKNVTLPFVQIEPNAIQNMSHYLKEHEFEHIVIVHDTHTKRAAGNDIFHMLDTEKFSVKQIELQANKHNQIIADESTLMQLFIETPRQTDVILAVGSGTIHDIVRFASYKMDMPFISVPTAASVDGFTSKGAPLIFKGFKDTIQTDSPIAVFADVNVLKKAPQALTAAGFGDILGKYTSLLDWKISELIADEPYSELAAQYTRQSLNTSINAIDDIAANNENGITILMQSLIDSGLVMLILDFSRPASGSEHHLSHYWEIDLLKRDEQQLLHGAKVGVATTIITDLYKQFFMNFDVQQLEPTDLKVNNIQQNWKSIQKYVNELPTLDELRTQLKTVGGPVSSTDLHVEDTLVTESLNEAIHLRNRYTGLRLINQLHKNRLQYPINL